ncbi:LysR family transcriptional regulator [Agrobacterium tumefaciens]|nr:LysR substrate-binding domain-containing protein [Agrobacterium tumefaciens]MQB07920.1 LysR family transcriptional regulator [Agrobacterium tumefaciens]
METRFLHTFLLVIETGSVAEAARRQNITPSAATQRIKALEADIGQPLLQRAGQRMEATVVGSALVSQVRQIIALEGDMKASSSPAGETGLLRVGVIQTALTGIFPPVLADLNRNHPGVDLHLIPGASGELYNRLGDGELEAAIIVKPHFEMPKSLEWLTLRTEPLLLVCPLGLDSSEPMILLQTERFLRYDRNHWGGRLVDQYLKQKRIRPREHFELDSLEAIVVMVSQGVGISIIPDWPRPWPEGVHVEQHILADAPRREIGLTWSRTSRRLPLIKTLVGQVKITCL